MEISLTERKEYNLTNFLSNEYTRSSLFITATSVLQHAFDGCFAEQLVNLPVGA